MCVLWVYATHSVVIKKEAKQTKIRNKQKKKNRNRGNLEKEEFLWTYDFRRLEVMMEEWGERAGKAAGASSWALTIYHLSRKLREQTGTQGRHSDRQAQFQWRSSYNKVTFPGPPQTAPQQGTKRSNIRARRGDLIHMVMLYIQNCEVGRAVIMFTLWMRGLWCCFIYYLFVINCFYFSVFVCVPPFCRCPRRPEEGAASPTAAVAGSCGPPTHMNWLLGTALASPVRAASALKLRVTSPFIYVCVC